jgi:hypothetical protein
MKLPMRYITLSILEMLIEKVLADHIAFWKGNVKPVAEVAAEQQIREI